MYLLTSVWVQCCSVSLGGLSGKNLVQELPPLVSEIHEAIGVFFLNPLSTGILPPGALIVGNENLVKYERKNCESKHVENNKRCLAQLTPEILSLKS